MLASPTNARSSPFSHTENSALRLNAAQNPQRGAKVSGGDYCLAKLLAMSIVHNVGWYALSAFAQLRIRQTHSVYPGPLIVWSWGVPISEWVTNSLPDSSTC